MDSRIILIVFSIYLTRVSNGLQCNALACSVNNGTDNVCKNLGKTENSTECGFYPCMKATGSVGWLVDLLLSSFWITGKMRRMKTSGFITVDMKKITLHYVNTRTNAGIKLWTLCLNRQILRMT